MGESTSGAHQLEATADHCKYCFDVLLEGLQVEPLSKQVRISGRFKAPLFITWSKRRSGREYELRGCIGCFDPLELVSGIRQYALTSAFRDSRFQPIAESEITDLRVSVSLLVNFEKAASWDDWVVGTHGIRIRFKVSRRTFSATYLPEVSQEQGWTKFEAMESLVQKAGFSGVVDTPLLSKVSVERYQSSKYSLSYQEYLDSCIKQE